MPCQSGERASCSRIWARVSSWVGATLGEQDEEEEEEEEDVDKEFWESELVVDEQAYDRECEIALLLLLISGMERGG